MANPRHQTIVQERSLKESGLSEFSTAGKQQRCFVSLINQQRFFTQTIIQDNLAMVNRYIIF